MKTPVRNLLQFSAAAALLIAPMAFADNPAPPPVPTPAAAPEVIVVRTDAPGFAFASNDASAIGGANVDAKMVKAAFLGVGVSAAPEVLTEQLQLPQGVGLVVEFVEKNSPAEKAGLQSRDLLHKLDEQLLINPQQFATLVRTFKPGATVRLTVLRKGQVLTLEATLVEKELPELTSNLQAFQFSTAPQFPEMRIAPLPPDVLERVAAPGRAEARIIRVMPGASSRIIKIDDGLRIEIETDDGQKTLRVTDKDGTSIFEGPYNTPEEMEKLPSEYRERVKSAEEGVELKEVPATSPTQPKAEALDLFPEGPTT